MLSPIFDPDGKVNETKRLTHASKQKTIAATESINTTNPKYHEHS